MGNFIASALSFFGSVSGIVTALGTIISFILAAVLDPAGWLNQSLCFVISMILSVFPSTPASLRFESIIVSLGSMIPVIGLYAVREAYHAFRDVFSLIIVFKLYKLIPFKAT